MAALKQDALFQSSGEALRYGFTVYVRNIPSILAIFLPAGVLGELAYALASWLYIQLIIQEVSAQATPLWVWIAEQVGFILLGGTLVALSLTLPVAATARFLGHHLIGRPISPWAAYGAVLRRFGSYLLTLLLLVGVYALAFLFSMLYIGFVGWIMRVLALIIGFVTLAYLPAVHAIEGRWGLEALNRSYKLFASQWPLTPLLWPLFLALPAVVHWTLLWGLRLGPILSGLGVGLAASLPGTLIAALYFDARSGEDALQPSELEHELVGAL